jgi:c-di-GMP-binding flagellar brake protein YcgR
MDATPSKPVPRKLDPAERRRAPRVEIAVECRLVRPMGSPITALTIDLGPSGMRVESPRPLTADEELDFEIPRDQGGVAGRARVMRMHERNVYGLRFERLPADARTALQGLTAGREQIRR